MFTHLFDSKRMGKGRICAALLCAALLAPMAARADEPYARTRDYDLQNIRTHLWFDTDNRKIRGEATETISALRDGVSRLLFDSVALNIESVTVDGAAAKFSTSANDLAVELSRPAKRGEKHQVMIRYNGQPKKGVYFVLPDKNYPHQPKEVFTQGEAEDTRYYIPIYDYPNDRTTSEMILTVPGTWTTISNGQLAGVKDEPDGTKTWDWKQSAVLSTYLISAIAGEFDEKDETWRGIPLRFTVPRGEAEKIDSSFARTKQMLEVFSDKLGVPYPWSQYAQTSVDDFMVGGMENTSATTLATSELVNPQLVSELRIGSDDVYSHELAHQWFGDLVTCKDWANLWLNEGFATYFEHYWLEQHYGADDAAYEFWRDASGWFRQRRLYAVPIVNRNFTDSIEYEGNIYTKGGWVLRMLRSQLGDEKFFAGLHNYLQTNRGQNVVTADLEKAIEQATSVNTDKFFHQWVYGAGAPEFDVSYTYDTAARQVKMNVKQIQKVEGLVGIFDVPVDVEIATSSGRKIFPIEVSQANQSFTFPSDGAPLMVLFDKGDKILKTVNFDKDPAMLIYQLKNAEDVPDRANAAVALGALRDNPDAIAALGDAAQHDPFWGIRVEGLRALGRIGGGAAEKPILAAVTDEKPWVREIAVGQLGRFSEDASLGSKLADVAANDKAYRVRVAGLESLGELKSANAYDILAAAVKSDSPDDSLRNAALAALGTLADPRAVPILTEWMAPGKPMQSRNAAITSLGGLDKKNKDITRALISYLDEPHFDLRLSVAIALARRGDTDAIGPLENLVAGGGFGMGEGPVIEGAIDALKAQTAGR
jgi:aminopeptidase N